MGTVGDPGNRCDPLSVAGGRSGRPAGGGGGSRREGGGGAAVAGPAAMTSGAIQ